MTSQQSRGTYSVVAEAEKGLYFRRYPYRRYNKLGPISFWPSGSLIFEKRCCSCSKLVKHAELTPYVQQPMKKWHVQLLAYFMKSALLFFRIGSYINIFHWNRHVAIYFRQFDADKGVNGPKIYPKYDVFWWFWPNWRTFSCTLLPIHVTTVSDLTLFIIQDVSLMKNSVWTWWSGYNMVY